MIEKVRFDREAWSQILRVYRGEIGPLAACTIGSVLQSMLVLPTLLLVRMAFDRAVPTGGGAMLLGIGAAVIALRLGGSLIALAIRSRIVRIIRTATLRLRCELLGELYAGSAIAHEGADKARLHTRIVFDTERVDNMADAVLSGALPAAATCLILSATLLYLNPLLTVLGAAVLPLLWVGGRWSGRRMQSDTRAFQAQFEEFGRSMRFVLDHLPLTRARSAEEWEMARQEAGLARLRDAAVRMADGSARHSHLQTNLLGLPGVLILVVGGLAVAGGSLTLGGFLAFYVAAGLLNGQIDRLSGVLPAVITGNEAVMTLRRMRLAFGQPPYTGTRALAWTGAITLDAVSFAYDSVAMLRCVSLDIRPGDCIAIIGPNGAGKTTLLNLILGFFPPLSGKLLADGIAYDAIDLRRVRRSIGYVPQHPALFAGTVFENIAYGRPEVTREDVMTALRLASADGLVARLPLGLDTPIGDGGALLSGGEGQLLTVARAHLGDLRLLILDEPTNHLDQATIAGLMGAIAGQATRPAILLVSHDPAVVAYAKTVWRLDDGRLHQVRGSAVALEAAS